MDWILSITSIIMLWLMGNKTAWGPVVGLFNQVLWFAYATYTEQYGLLLGVIVFFFVHIRNFRKWRREAEWQHDANKRMRGWSDE